MNETEKERANRELMEEFGLNGRPPFGDILSIRPFGDIAVVEARGPHTAKNDDGFVWTTTYHPYVNGERCHEITEHGWDKAFLIALGKKYQTYRDFPHLVAKMLGME